MTRNAKKGVRSTTSTHQPVQAQCENIPRLSLPDSIAKADDLAKWVDQAIQNVEVSSEDRFRVSAACFDLTQEHHRAITSLIRENLIGSSFALVRSIFESYLRGLWLLHCATDLEVERFIKLDKINLDCWQLIGAIEGIDGFQAGTLKLVKQNSWREMNSYTHSGMMQISRRLTDSTIEPKYSHGAILEVIEFANALAILATIAVAGMSNNLPLGEKALKMAYEYAASKPEATA